MLSKNTMSTLLVGTIILGFLVNANAQDPKSIIKKMADSYKNVKSYSGTLEIEQAAGGKKQSAQITVKFTGEKSYSRQITTAGNVKRDVLTVDDGKVAYMQPDLKTYMKGPHINTPKGTMGASVAQGLANPQVQLKMLPAATIAGQSVYAIEVSSPGGKAQVYISKANFHLLQVKMSSPQGSLTRTIKNEQINPKLPDSLFVYHPPKGAVEKKLPVNPAMPGAPGAPKKP